MIDTPTIDPRTLRGVLGRFATGVVVVTTRTDDGLAIGMTVNSFCSVSLEPPLVLFCVSRASQLHPLFTGASHFAVNVLSEAQRKVSLSFARPGRDRFKDLTPDTGRLGAPVLPDALAVVECTRASIVEAGDHDIVIGRVVAMSADEQGLPDPLVFYGGAYRRLDPQHADWWTAFA
ncbi:flavin reductase family protein [Streptomyces sp. NPDC005374]|uniref:flavin reductase family protein n=1 Tax=Streptomyces sp. NPDC005374 TaxID=3364713 RepID=UPI003685711A